jgi:hypothetical protein
MPAQDQPPRFRTETGGCETDKKQQGCRRGFEHAHFNFLKSSSDLHSLKTRPAYGNPGSR